MRSGPHDVYAISIKWRLPWPLASWMGKAECEIDELTNWMNGLWMIEWMLFSAARWVINGGSRAIERNVNQFGCFAATFSRERVNCLLWQTANSSCRQRERQSQCCRRRRRLWHTLCAWMSRYIVGATVAGCTSSTSCDTSSSSASKQQLVALNYVAVGSQLAKLTLLCDPFAPGTYLPNNV